MFSRDNVSPAPVSPGLLKLLKQEQQEAAWAKAAGGMRPVRATTTRSRVRKWLETLAPFGNPSRGFGDSRFDHTRIYTDGERYRIFTEPYALPAHNDVRQAFAGLVTLGWELQILPGVWSPGGALLVVLTSPEGVPLPKLRDLGLSREDAVCGYSWSESW